MKKFAIGCLAVVGVITVVAVAVAIIGNVFDSDGTTETTTQTLAGTTTPTMTTSPAVTMPTMPTEKTTTLPTTTTTSLTTTTTTHTTTTATTSTEQPPTEIEVELIQAQSDGLIELTASGSTHPDSIELVINSLSEDQLYVTILPGTIFGSQPAGAKSSMVVLEPSEVWVPPGEVLGPLSIEAAGINMSLDVPGMGDSLVISTELATGNLKKLIDLPEFQDEYFSIQQLAIWTLTDNPGLNEYPGTAPSIIEIDKIRFLFEKAGIPTEGYRALKPPVYVDLVEAVDGGLIGVSAAGTGYITYIKMSLTSNSDEILEVAILPGTIFTSPASGIQSMVVIDRELVIRVYPHEMTELFNVDAACASMELDAPEESNSLTLTAAAPPEDLVKLLGLPDFYEEDFRVQQFAIWTITDNPERDGYMGIATGFQIFGTGPSDEEMAKIRTLFEKAGISTDKYKALS